MGVQKKLSRGKNRFFMKFQAPPQDPERSRQDDFGSMPVLLALHLPPPHTQREHIQRFAEVPLKRITDHHVVTVDHLFIHMLTEAGSYLLCGTPLHTTTLFTIKVDQAARYLTPFRV